jgi:hypothetical protein
VCGRSLESVTSWVWRNGNHWTAAFGGLAVDVCILIALSNSSVKWADFITWRFATCGHYEQDMCWNAYAKTQMFLPWQNRKLHTVKDVKKSPYSCCLNVCLSCTVLSDYYWYCYCCGEVRLSPCNQTANRALLRLQTIREWNTQQRRNDIDRGKSKNSEKTLSQRHFVHHMNWPGREPGLPQ